MIGRGTRCSVHNSEVTVKETNEQLGFDKPIVEITGGSYGWDSPVYFIIFYLGAANCIISTAQHARPNCIGHIEPYKYETKRVHG